MPAPAVDCADAYYADQCGTILKRTAATDPDSWNWKESDIFEKQFSSAVFARNEHEKKGGLIFISKGGLHEAAFPGETSPALNITLFRSFSKTVGTNGEPDGLLQGDLTFDYAIAPVADETDAELMQMKENFVSRRKNFHRPRRSIEKFRSVYGIFVRLLRLRYRNARKGRVWKNRSRRNDRARV